MRTIITYDLPILKQFTIGVYTVGLHKCIIHTLFQKKNGEGQTFLSTSCVEVNNCGMVINRSILIRYIIVNICQILFLFNPYALIRIESQNRGNLEIVLATAIGSENFSYWRLIADQFHSWIVPILQLSLTIYVHERPLFCFQCTEMHPEMHL